MKKQQKGPLAQGSITLDAQPDPINIAYQEHADRNGQLLAETEQLQLTKSQLDELNQKLRDAEEKLKQGRARYASMAYMDNFMTEAFGHLVNQPEDND